MTECKHGMVNGTCSFCRFEKNVVNKARRRKSDRGFPASYPGECSVNGDKIYPGDMIISAWGGFAHTNCWESS